MHLSGALHVLASRDGLILRTPADTHPQLHFSAITSRLGNCTKCTVLSKPALHIMNSVLGNRVCLQPRLMTRPHGLIRSSRRPVKFIAIGGKGSGEDQSKPSVDVGDKVQEVAQRVQSAVPIQSASTDEPPAMHVRQHLSSPGSQHDGQSNHLRSCRTFTSASRMKALSTARMRMLWSGCGLLPVFNVFLAGWLRSPSRRATSSLTRSTLPTWTSR